MSGHPRYYSPHDAPFWESVGADEMRLQCCTGCGLFRYPPAASCAGCLSTDARWEAVSGRGKVLSWTTFHRQYLPAYPAPHTVVAAELEEGPIFISNIDREEVGDLRLEAPVRIVYGDHPDGYRIARFTLRGAS